MRVKKNINMYTLITHVSFIILSFSSFNAIISWLDNLISDKFLEIILYAKATIICSAIKLTRNPLFNSMGDESSSHQIRPCRNSIKRNL